MSDSWASQPQEDGVEPAPPIQDVADTGEVAEPSPEHENTELPPVPAPPPPQRPLFQRNALVTAPPPSAPMAPPPPQANGQAPAPAPNPNDSLSLLQLRRIVAEFNRADPVAYDFEYADVGPHAEEIDEWFVYQFWQWIRLNSAQRAFEWHWQHDFHAEHAWDDATNDMRTRFIQAAIAGVQSNDTALRSASIGKLLYLVLGRWGDTAMPNATPGDNRTVASRSQLKAIRAGVECLSSLEGLPVVWTALKNSFEVHWYALFCREDARADIRRSGDPQGQHGNLQEAQDELLNLMTIMYIAIQETLNDPDDMSPTYGKLCRSVQRTLYHKLTFDSGPQSALG